MGWNRGSIREERSKIVHEKFANSTREELLAAIVEREVALYPFYATMGSLNDKSAGTIFVTSCLFPESINSASTLPVPEGDGRPVYVYNKETKKLEIAKARQDNFHNLDYELVESMEITDGSQIDDSAELISVHESELVYILRGSIFMADVRFVAAIMKKEK